MTSRIHILLDESEKDRYLRQAEREGKSLGAWLRAAEHGPSLRTRAELQRFFDGCDAREHGREPDWTEHRAAIERSRRSGLDVT